MAIRTRTKERINLAKAIKAEYPDAEVMVNTFDSSVLFRWQQKLDDGVVINWYRSLRGKLQWEQFQAEMEEANTFVSERERSMPLPGGDQ